ncbi:uncharacterized protein [Montipora foliosa]|uniref:uncharacterized protein n=1 Tax=Montipora foliosa TaxID=591990 RepID=UPI0035F10411
MLLLFEAFFAFLLPFRCSALRNRKTSCDSHVFEVKVDHALQNHVIATRLVRDEFECQLSCLLNDTCQSFNVILNKGSNPLKCELNNATRRENPTDFKLRKGFSHYEPIQVSCLTNPYDSENIVNSGKCHPEYKGKNCLTPKVGWSAHVPGYSCKHIRDSGDSKGDGEYWIDPEKSGNPLKVFCDMTTDGGGWLLVYNVVIDSNSVPVRLTPEKTYRGISNYNNNRMVLNPVAMKQLRSYMNYTQLRFRCSKPQGRTFHVTTIPNTFGEAVVSFFSNQTDVHPQACGSFKRMEDDNSYLAADCSKWGKVGKTYHVGKWGHGNRRRLHNIPLFIRDKYYWANIPDRWECDDFGTKENGNWMVFVR